MKKVMVWIVKLGFRILPWWLAYIYLKWIFCDCLWILKKKSGCSTSNEWFDNLTKEQRRSMVHATVDIQTRRAREGLKWLLES